VLRDDAGAHPDGRARGEAAPRRKRRVEAKPLLRQESLVYAVPTERKSRLAAKMCAGQKVRRWNWCRRSRADMTALLAKARQCAEAGIDAINIPDGPGSARSPR